KFNEIKLHSNFDRVQKINVVSFEKNKMVFKNGAEDYATVNGMRDYGPYQVPEDIKNTQLLFIYPDKESASKLYEYLSRGYRHFPGLESYVGIPANVYSLKICYENNLNIITQKISQELTEDNYNNLIAVCIMPFSKSTATTEESKEYYKIKKILLEKNIPSQFIHRSKIFEENFHFSLPNIAIAMLAKCGGIPWKLAKPHYNQLTIGFNVFTQKTVNNTQTFLGSAVFFDNEGIIKQVAGLQKNSIEDITHSLVSAISSYKKEKAESINKLVIHFYKTLNYKEVKEIEKITKENLGKDSSFAIVEINDSKTTLDLCFDLKYDSFMPQSGTYIQLKLNEYLLFNNLRYWEKPINPINQEELPIKVRIFDPYNNFDHHELISQVYEFSRMYWKSLKQKAQPVTTIYSKLIANYVSEFGGSLPYTDVAKKRVWFI
ncbi:MAG: Piwi domain-containing protein, partial [Melioribacteraceae bacterium]|nr:Piwi domain-containing protein [Melioribacteraceae bacterium]